ncbi:PaaI family thioesterase [Streptomyces hirsutus]|uniref:PaaI family thioesterase n=1 Tax=Streptomyces hirsutus TaxID=35620 RepID=UPI003439FE91
MTADDRQMALEELASAARRMVQVVITTDAGADTVRATAEELNKLAERIDLNISGADYRDRYDAETRKTANPFDSPRNPLAPPLRTLAWEGGRYQGEVELGPAHEGPPGRVHGGVVAGLLDNCSGRATSSLGLFAMSAKIEVRFLAGTPYGEPLTITADVVEQDGRRLTVDAEVETVSGQVTATSRALFVRIDEHGRWRPPVAELSPLD